MYSKLFFLFALLSVDAAPNVYDQSQNGELNIQVDLKDIQIFALLKGKHEEYYEDIDYAYDYSEMTIKPQMSTSKKPLNVTTDGSSAENVTETTIKPEISTSQKPLNVTTPAASTENVTEITIKPTISTSQKLMDVSTTGTSRDNAIEMTIESATSTSQKPLRVTTSGTSTDNVTELTTKPQVSILTKTVNLTTSSTLTDYIVATTVSTLETSKNNTEEHHGFLNFFSLLFDPFTATTISNNAQSRLLEPQSREDDGVTTTSKNNMEVVGHTETIHTNASDLVTREPNRLMSKISPIKSEIETKTINSSGSTTKSPTNIKCKKGFILNQRGGCELKLQTMLNASRLLKIVKLSQKLKPRRHRNGQDTL